MQSSRWCWNCVVRRVAGDWSGFQCDSVCVTRLTRGKPSFHIEAHTHSCWFNGQTGEERSICIYIYRTNYFVFDAGWYARCNYESTSANHELESQKINESNSMCNKSLNNTSLKNIPTVLSNSNTNMIKQWNTDRNVVDWATRTCVKENFV